jgi:hypothetical protein
MTTIADFLCPKKEQNIENFRLLSQISTEALVLLKRGQIRLLEETRNLYQGKWERIELDKRQFASLAPEHVLEEMSIEVISALSDMTDHVHYHDNSYALLTILGGNEGYPEPEECMMFFKSTRPIPAVAGITLQAEPGVIHSFSNGKTPLSFLSVQSRKIDTDYHLVSDAAA